MTATPSRETTAATPDDSEAKPLAVNLLSLASQLTALGATRTAGTEPPTAKRNGVPAQASATRLVLDYLRSQPGFRRQCDIRWALKLSHSSVAWALQCLRRAGLVDVVQDAARNPRYMRYRART